MSDQTVFESGLSTSRTAAAPLVEPENGTRPPLAEATVRLWEALAPLDVHLRRSSLATGCVDRHLAGQAFQLGDGVAVLVAGCLSLDADGSGLSAGLAVAGDVVAAGSGMGVSGAWITDGELYRTTLTDWLERSGEAGLLHLLTASERRSRAVRRQVACVARHRATARVADLLLTVHMAAGASRIRLSQDRFGAMLGLRRTTVNASSRTLHDLGAIRTMRGEVRILDGVKLAGIACGCTQAAADDANVRRRAEHDTKAAVIRPRPRP